MVGHRSTMMSARVSYVASYTSRLGLTARYLFNSASSPKEILVKVFVLFLAKLYTTQFETAPKLAWFASMP